MHIEIHGSSPRVWGQVIGCNSSSNSVRIIPTRVGTRCQRVYLCTAKQDHPHACGDKLICSAYRHGGIGSSPRVWGQVTKKMVDDLKARIIPTRVGTSSFLHFNQSFFKDHPHACGDKILRHYYMDEIAGSSPRVWGQVKLIDSFGSLDRIIPTRVGTR